MGRRPQPARPAAAPVRRFLYSEPEPWSWIPGTSIQAGTVFVTRTGDFFRFAVPQDNGWDCDPVAPSDVGPPADVARIIETRRRYDGLLAAREQLEARMLGDGDTAESRVLLRDQNRELLDLRDELVRLCNAREPNVLESQKVGAAERRKLLLVLVLAAVFVVATAWSVTAVYRVSSEIANRLYGRLLFAAAVLVTGAGGLYLVARRRNRLLRNQYAGNIIGCLILATLLLLAVGFIIAFLAAGGIYVRAYDKI